MALQTSPKQHFIAAGGGGIVPQIDAPVTASNAGERRVTISCGTSTISLPVTSETTPADLLFSAANVMTQKINPATSVVTETYRQLFLERRLRRYEPVKDVLNSWDCDSQNSLQIIPREISAKSDWDLALEVVPKTVSAPAGFCFYMYHSGRAGKWQKRHITLLETGQMFMAKKPDTKINDKDAQTLCHLSDFDIFLPPMDVGPSAWRVLKAPKRHCYAVKSLQKQAVFPNGENFVHFFCTDDAELSIRFHDAIHSWRSWYLVNKKGVVDTASAETATKIGAGSAGPVDRVKAEVSRLGHLRMKVSVDETPYTIGAFEPLIDMARFDKPIEDFGKDFLPSKAHSRPQRRETTKAPNSERYVPKPSLLSRSTSVSNRTANRVDTHAALAEAPPVPSLPKTQMSPQRSKPQQTHGGQFLSKTSKAPTFPLVAGAINVNLPNAPSPSSPTLQSPQQYSQRKPPSRKNTAQAETGFMTTGLLGATYEKRKQEAAAVAATPTNTHNSGNPFTEAPSLLNGGKTMPVATQSIHSTALPSRSKSVRVPGSIPATSSGGFHSHSQKLQQQAPPMPNAFTQDQQRRGRTTNVDASRTNGSRSRSRGAHAAPVRPLLDFDTPLPSARRDRPGNPVRAPTGVPLVDLAGGGGLVSAPMPPMPKSNSGGSLGRANTVRNSSRNESRGRQATAGGDAAPRSRSMNRHGSSAGRNTSRVRRADAPPMPPMPQALTSDDYSSRRYH